MSAGPHGGHAVGAWPSATASEWTPVTAGPGSCSCRARVSALAVCASLTEDVSPGPRISVGTFADIEGTFLDTGGGLPDA